jgi:aspartyl/glutamyl-tRNA(Asn/Gln) amidotransferase C subunit
VESKERKIDQHALDLLCKMSSIALTQDEADQILIQLNKIADLFDQISTHTTMKDTFARRSNVLDEDIPQEFPSVHEILQNVPSVDGQAVVCPVMKFQGSKK